ncbi:MAG TPA: VCBS repeat-containing protein, partial [Phycicoccus sp.]
GYDRVLTAGLWDADGVSDVIVRDAAGVLYLRRGTTSGTFGPPEEIGRGWQVFDLIVPVGDFDGDGNADLLGRAASDGSLWLYSGDGAGGFRSSRAVGSGWGGFDAILGVGDFTGDGAVDVVARSPRGYLYLYPGNGRGSWLRYSRIGSGWYIFDALTAVGDFDGDRRADVLGRRTDGTLWLYRGNGKGGWLSYAKVGAGWQMFSTILH